MLVTLTTERLRLVPFSGGDVDALHALWTNPDVRRHLWDDVVISRSRAAETVEGAIASAEAAGVGMWTLRRLDSPDVVIGFCGLRHLPEGETVELLYALLPQHWRRGLATEASRAVLRYAFVELGLPRVLAGADPANADSFRVIQRLGMRLVSGGVAEVPGAVYCEIEAAAFASREESTQ